SVPYCMTVISSSLVAFYSDCSAFCSFFFHTTPTTHTYTLSLHDALPISWLQRTVSSKAPRSSRMKTSPPRSTSPSRHRTRMNLRSEEHTSELQSRENLVCRLLLEKKKKTLEPRRALINCKHLTPLPVSK